MTRNAGRRRWIALTAVCLAAVRLPALAGADVLADKLRQCARERDEAKRLTCFDAVATSLPKLQTDQFGLTAEIARKRDPDARAWGNDEALTGKIVGLREAAQGRLIFTLDNGQVWQQTDIRPGVHFAVGDTVRLEHGAMSSLWMSADHDRKTRVKRIS